MGTWQSSRWCENMASFQLDFSPLSSDVPLANGESVDDQAAAPFSCLHQGRLLMSQTEVRGPRAGPQGSACPLGRLALRQESGLSHAVLKCSVVDLWDQQL